jgi:hypothetical protein
VDPASADRHAAAGSALPGALGGWLTRCPVMKLLALLAVGYDENWLPGGFPAWQYRASAAGGARLLAAAPALAELA